MANVMLGRSDGIAGFERHVVLKCIRPELARDRRLIEMFLHEARVVATLHHQHIVQVHDIGEANGEYFLVMEYVHGEDVRKILANAARQRTHIPLGYAVAIVSAAAAGLHYAHERRGADGQPLHIVHRDVSPSNILVGYDGSIKVVDFGVAAASIRQETRAGSLKGKLSYMAPEQCRGMQVDRRADVYALGVVLYELATATRMIKGDNDYRVVEQIVHGKIAPPQTRRPGLPAELSEIILRALATDRDQRYSTADELRTALDQFATSHALTASTSVIAAYMRQQFGQRPEPWLKLDGRGDDAPTAPATALDEPVPSNSWVESPYGSADRRVTPSSLPRRSGPIGALGGGAAAPTARNGQPALQPRASSAPPTDSRLGWERLPRVLASRGIPAQTLAIGGSGALVAGLVLWLVAGPGADPAPASTAASDAVPPPLAAAVAMAPPAPPPLPAAPQVIAAAALDAHRIAGGETIAPDSATMDAIARSGTDKVVSSYKVCVGPDGNIDTVSPLETSGFPAYDDKIQNTIRRGWRYRPFLVDGKATAICSAIRLVYSKD
jgi:serine/threonine-protein kinase